jgi:hypothetical protein
MASDRTLVQALAAALDGSEPVSSMRRSMNSFASWHPSEVVTCSVGSRTVEVLCKYDLPVTRTVHGLPSGVRYEADAYRLAVRPCSLSAPRSFGLFGDEDGGATGLMLEYVAGSCRLPKSLEPRAIGRAARWLGSFHRYHDRRGMEPSERLNRYDEATLFACMERARRGCAPLRAEYPWFERLVIEYQQVFRDLLLRRPTVIHGEFYPKNILMRERTVFPVDWERAAIFAGEVDLAALTEGHWDPEDVLLAVDSYAASRWETDVPEDFAECLEAARVYLHLYALGNEPDEPFKPGAKWRFEQLELAAAKRDLI